MKKVAVFLATSILWGESYTYSKLPQVSLKAVSLKAPRGLALYGGVICRDPGDPPVSGGRVYKEAPFEQIPPEIAILTLQQERSLWADILHLGSELTPIGFGIAVAIGASSAVLGATGGSMFVSKFLDGRAKKIGELPRLNLLGSGKLDLGEGDCGHVIMAGTDPPTEPLPVTKFPQVLKNPTVEESPIPGGIFIIPKEPTLDVPMDTEKLLDIYRARTYTRVERSSE